MTSGNEGTGENAQLKVLMQAIERHCHRRRCRGALRLLTGSALRLLIDTALRLLTPPAPSGSSSETGFRCGTEPLQQCPNSNTLVTDSMCMGRGPKRLDSRSSDPRGLLGSTAHRFRIAPLQQGPMNNGQYVYG